HARIAISAVAAGVRGSLLPRHRCAVHVSTSQNRQTRVHLAPISMMVAVPAFQHSPRFGHFASSQTVARRCCLTSALTRAKAAPVGAFALSHGGLGAGARPLSAPRLMPSRMAVNP